MHIDDQDRYVIDGYQQRPTFASFLPGIAGPYGIPLWAFYVNRGQCISSFGIESKDGAIVEFQPANKAYRDVSSLGFRTFIKIARPDESNYYYEPFARFSPEALPESEMRVGLNDLVIRERNESSGLEVEVTYFILPSEVVGALVRRVVIRNASSDALRGELLDGLPAILPYGVANWMQKEMSNTMSAWMRAENMENGVPFYRVEASVEDQPEVEEIESGHFYLCFSESAGVLRRLTPIVDPTVIFGSDTAFAYPERFLSYSLDRIYKSPQIASGRQPCGMFGSSFTLDASESITLCSLIGHASSVDTVNANAKRIASGKYIRAKHAEAQTLAADITKAAETKTASREFDLYCRQGFLDNVLRGGYPLVVPTRDRLHVYHIYERRHGDLERDYNFFSLAPENFSQGNGAYRDINQNRRCDVLIEPDVEDETVSTFINLLQLDGYNPLEIRPSTFTLDAEGVDYVLSLTGGSDGLRRLLEQPFTLGGVLRFIADHDIKIKGGKEAYIEALLRHARQHNHANHHEGYWIDHWTYNLDLLDTYLAMYPDRKEAFLFGRAKYTYFDSGHAVLPRDAKYVEWGSEVRQSGAVVEDLEKTAVLEARTESRNSVRTRYGQGEVYRTSLFAKLFGLSAIKVATLDPSGMGIEMEAGRPAWCDALNGLPGLFGSSVSETYELRRLIRLLNGAAVEFPDRQVAIPREIWEFAKGLQGVFAECETSSDDYACWDRACGLREALRSSTRLGLSGEEVQLVPRELVPIIESFDRRVQRGIERAGKLGDDLPITYLAHEPARWALRTDASGTVLRNVKGQALVRVDSFTPRALPPYLEGVVKALRSAESRKEAAALHERVKQSSLFDAKLGMYKLNASLAGEPMHIGRARAYTPGWLENESIFLHMHYKYLLALLTAGLYSEFWTEARNGLIPFLDPEIYGRSVLENSSFITSSAHPDASMHGRGFVARLSGATAELMTMWFRATVGPQPFKLTDSGLAFELAPALPGWLFAEKGTLSFTIFGKVAVTYHNPDRVDVFPGGDVAVSRITIRSESGERVEIVGGRVDEPWASAIRVRKVKRIDAYLERVGAKHERAADAVEVHGQ